MKTTQRHGDTAREPTMALSFLFRRVAPLLRRRAYQLMGAIEA
ncbi:MAG: hypothetical protein ACJ74J_06090 [Blastocatellia bacterium]